MKRDGEFVWVVLAIGFVACVLLSIESCSNNTKVYWENLKAVGCADMKRFNTEKNNTPMIVCPEGMKKVEWD